MALTEKKIICTGQEAYNRKYGELKAAGFRNQECHEKAILAQRDAQAQRAKEVEREQLINQRGQYCGTLGSDKLTGDAHRKAMGKAIYEAADRTAEQAARKTLRDIQLETELDHNAREAALERARREAKEEFLQSKFLTRKVGNCLALYRIK